MPSHSTIPDWSPTVPINITHLIDDVQGSASAYERSEYAVQHISVQMPPLASPVSVSARMAAQRSGPNVRRPCVSKGRLSPWRVSANVSTVKVSMDGLLAA